VAASLSGTTRGLEVFVLVSLTSRRWIDTCDQSSPQTSSWRIPASSWRIPVSAKKRMIRAAIEGAWATSRSTCSAVG
jgi:hypothetical protein